MIYFLIFVIGIVVGVICVQIFETKREGTKSAEESAENPASNSLVERQAREKDGHKKQVMELLEKQPSVTNNEVEQLLGVSDATATRYLEELEKEGKTRQVGKTGGHVFYEKI